MNAKQRIPATDRLRQHGVYAVEFALVFLVLFTFLYATIGYGVYFAMRAGVQNAAEDGARAGLRFQVVNNNGTQLPLRIIEAEAVATQQIQGWTQSSSRQILAVVCQSGVSECATPSCGKEWSQRCQIVVTVKVSGITRLFPALPIPDELLGKASMLIDGAAL